MTTALGFVVLAAAGAVARHRLAVFDRAEGWPLGTATANVVATFALAALASASTPVRTAAGVGAMGALSTWSTFVAQIAERWNGGQRSLAVGYAFGSIVVGGLAAWAGLRWDPLA